MDAELIKEQAVTRQLILASLKKLEMQFEDVHKVAQQNSTKLLVIETEAKLKGKSFAIIISMASSVGSALLTAFLLGKL